MNTELNLVNILKDCPSGTKLYSTMYGEVEFVRIDIGDSSPIRCIISKNGSICGFTKDGRGLSFYEGGDCVLFPSKDQRDWSKFGSEVEMIDGELYYCHTHVTESIFVYKKQGSFRTEYHISIQRRKCGDNNYSTYSLSFDSVVTVHELYINTLRKATDEEKDRFLTELHRYNFDWDMDKKSLLRIEYKFNIDTLRPFDKILVRDNDAQRWRCDFYERHNTVNGCFQVTTIGRSCWNQCVPYNSETMNLVGTSNQPFKEYIIWK